MFWHRFQSVSQERDWQEPRRARDARGNRGWDRWEERRDERREERRDERRDWRDEWRGIDTSRWQGSGLMVRGGKQQSCL